MSGFDYRPLEGLPESSIRLDRVARGLAASARAGRTPRVLEAGIGSGDATLRFAARYPDWTALDPDGAVLARLRERLASAGIAGVRVVKGSLERTRLPRGAFDRILLLNLLEHLDDPVAALARVRAMLAPGGAACITVPLSGSLHRRLAVEMGLLREAGELAASDRAFGHRRVYTPGLLRDHVRAAGLVPAHETPLYLKPLPTAALRGLPAAVHRGLDRLARRHPEFASYLYLEASLA